MGEAADVRSGEVELPTMWSVSSSEKLLAKISSNSDVGMGALLLYWGGLYLSASGCGGGCCAKNALSLLYLDSILMILSETISAHSPQISRR